MDVEQSCESPTGDEMQAAKRFVTIAAIAQLAAMCSTGGHAAVKANTLFSDNCVLQQGMSVPVWGSARDGEKVTVAFQKQRVSTVAENGKWMALLKPLKPGGPYDMRIQGDNSITLKNILVGEVWLCSGQSNMQWWVAVSDDAEKTIASSVDPQMRLLQVPLVAADAPQDDVDAAWKQAGPDSVPFFSAAGYYFGRDLRKALNAPIGLINASRGSTFAESWMRHDVLEANASFRIIFDRKLEPDLIPSRGSASYNGMLHPLIPFAIRGVIWYQGENNSDKPLQYRSLFPALIDSWRHEWGEGDFPFLFVQLAPLWAKTKDPVDPWWPGIRESQLIVSQTVPNTALAVITDYGEENQAHPKAKEPVGHRLALAARAIVYGEQIEYSGPIYKSVVIKGDRVVLSFTLIGSGLTVRGGALRGFAVCGEDRIFVWANATIQGDRVVVSSPSVPHPVAARYAWADFPEVNLYNEEGLPASPFRTDDFPLRTGQN